MGKNSGNKSRPSLRGSGSLPDYFNAAEPRSLPEPESGDVGNMAPATSDGLPLSKRDLQDLSADLKSHFDSAIDKKLLPISRQLSELASTLKDVSATAEAAMELGLTIQEDTKQLQRSEQQLSVRVAALETQARASNLKLRGLPETPDLNANLASMLAS